VLFINVDLSQFLFLPNMQELSLSDCVKLPLPVLTLATRASTTPSPRQPAIPVLERVVVTLPPAPTAKGEGEVGAATACGNDQQQRAKPDQRGEECSLAAAVVTPPPAPTAEGEWEGQGESGARAGMQRRPAAAC